MYTITGTCANLLGTTKHTTTVVAVSSQRVPAATLALYLDLPQNYTQYENTNDHTLNTLAGCHGWIVWLEFLKKDDKWLRWIDGIPTMTDSYL